MDIFTLTGIAIALSMDALSVSIVNGMLIKELKLRNALLIAASFGFFQGLMPFIGWLAGLSFRKYIFSYAHWVSFILLLFVGMKMLLESFQCKEDKTCKTCLEPSTLIIMSIATSIDALAVGVTFSIMNIDIAIPILFISFITFVICFGGIISANRFLSLCEKKLERIGGIVIIAIGIKIVAEHYLALG